MNLGLREVVWIAVGLLALYVVMQLGRIQGLRRARRSTSSAPPPESSGSLGRDLEVQQLHREVARLQQELTRAEGDWQARCRRLEADLRRMGEALDSVQAERSMSPQYGEAAVLARRGLTAEAIAERCGISVAEAELVRSLTQGGEQRPGEAA